MDYPKTYDSGTELPSVMALVHDVLPRLIAGDDPTLAGLRAQLQHMTVGQVELTGVGFHADLVVPPEVPVVQPAMLVGGDAEIVLSGAEHGAGCLLFVEAGRLSRLEGYTYGEEWRPDSIVLSVGHVFALDPSEMALNPTVRRGRQQRASATTPGNIKPMKALIDLTAEDLQRSPVWRYESNEGDATAIMEEVDRTSLCEQESDVFVVATTFYLADGSTVMGLCSPLDPSGLDYLQPVLFADGGQLPLWSDAGRDSLSIETVCKSMNRRPLDVFPLAFTCNIPVDGNLVSGTIDVPGAPSGRALRLTLTASLSGRLDKRS